MSRLTAVYDKYRDAFGSESEVAVANIEIASGALHLPTTLKP